MKIGWQHDNSARLIEEVDGYSIDRLDKIPYITSPAVLTFYERIDALAKAMLGTGYGEKESYLWFNLLAERYGNRRYVSQRRLEEALRDFGKAKNWSPNFAESLITAHIALEDYSRTLERIASPRIKYGFSDVKPVQIQPLPIEVGVKESVAFEPIITTNRSGTHRLKTAHRRAASIEQSFKSKQPSFDLRERGVHFEPIITGNRSSVHELKERSVVDKIKEM